MIRALRAVLRRHPVLFTGFLLALLATVFFAARTVMFTVYWSDPAHRYQPLEAWMTPRYIAHSWRLSPEEMQALMGGAAPLPGHRMTLHDIAEARGIPVGDLIAEITEALAARQPEGADR